MTKAAVIKTGGKQYLVREGAKLHIEKVLTAEGKKITFKDVLLTATDKAVKIGTPTVKGATVEGMVITHGKGKKITGVKMKAKKRYRRLFGHRQHFSEIEVTKIKTTS